MERKARLSDPDDVRRAICAFANDLPDHPKPGVVFIGQNDDGTCAGIEITDELLRRLADMHSDGNILPLPMMTVERRIVEGCTVAVVIVHPSDAPPVRFKGQVWVRVGPRRAIAAAEEERRLSEKRRARDLPFDVQPLRAYTLDDLDLDLFEREYLPSALAREILAQNDRSLEHQLISLRFADARDGVHPTPVGILVVGKDPPRYLPGAYIQFLRLDGVDLTDPIRHQEEITGPLPDLMKTLNTVLAAHVSVASNVVSGPTEIRHPDYPLEALRQLAYNAVLHRTYEGTNAPVRITWFADRVEIMNPGGPYGQVTRRNFGQPGVTDYRNPHLAEAMKNLGYVQRFGLGIPLARRRLEENGNPPPEFQVEDTYVLVVVRRRP